MTTMYYEYCHFVIVIFNMWCSSYNCVLLIHKDVDPCMEGQLGNKTRLTVEGC